MALNKGVIKYNADSLAKGIASSVFGLSITDYGSFDNGEYICDANTTKTGISILSQRSNYRHSILPAPQTDLQKDMGSNIGQAYDATTTSNGNIFYLTSSGNVIRNIAGVWTDLGVIVASSTADGGIWTHIDNTGIEKVYVAGNAGGNFVVKTMNNDGTGIAVLYNAAQPDATAQHRGTTGILNRTYMTNGRYIATYDPTTNTFTNNKINLGIGWITTSIRNYGNYMAITGYKSNAQSRLWLWDGASEFPNFQYNINDLYATCFAEGGRLFIFSSGKNATTKLYEFNNADISGEPIWQTSDTNRSALPEQGSIDSFNDGIYWKGTTGYIFAYQKYKGIWGVHKPYQGTTFNLSNSLPHLCKALYSNILYVSGGEGSNASSNTYFSSCNLVANTYSTVSSSFSLPTVVMPHSSTIEYVKVYFSEFTDLGVGKDPTFGYAVRNISTGIDFDNTGKNRIRYSDLTAAGLSPTNYTYHVFTLKSTPIDILKMTFFLTGCVVREIHVGYSYDDLTL